MTPDSVVIGGGAAGLVAAYAAAARGLDTVIIERNARCGRKLLITGKGRCNVTNTASGETLKKRYEPCCNRLGWLQKQNAEAGFSPNPTRLRMLFTRWKNWLGRRGPVR